MAAGQQEHSGPYLNKEVPEWRRCSCTKVHVNWISFKENDLFEHFCMLLAFCGISETALNKTVSLFGLMSLPAEICVWREAFIIALHHPRAVYQPLNLTLTISSVCVYIICVFVLQWAWRAWTFPLRPWFHWPSQSCFFSQFMLNMYDRFLPNKHSSHMCSHKLGECSWCHSSTSGLLLCRFCFQTVQECKKKDENKYVSMPG